MPGAGCPTSVPGAGMMKDQPSLSLKGQTETALMRHNLFGPALLQRANTESTTSMPSRPPPHQKLSLASVGGRVEPGESVYVSVMLQLMKDEPPLSLYLPPEGQTLEEEDEGHVEPLIPPVLPAEHAGGPSRSATPSAPEREVNSSHEAGSYREELEFQRSTSGGVGAVDVNMHLPSPPPSPPVARVASINQELEAKYIAAQDEIQRLRDLF
ncbi:hypothetical protein DEU56DRAFT_949171 [Suillus clintonianus]|uniref:uncharacterized protein n=1 Tax=Suillus clintonianus TaxID=1904413 RepID=UPI001B86DC93|nr:uncharacterized protein DEU56DRAFT_949171 [Suillus clintonianus]KAG2135244.1 hypothetical protein DEU56DRAFT_949171 [Suillus clintonianus]